MKKMLVVVDFQHDFIDGQLGFDGAEKLDDGIVKKIREYKANGDVIVQTRDTHFNHYLATREGKHLPVPHCIHGTHGWELYGKTADEFENMIPFVDFYQMNKMSFGVEPCRMLDLHDWLSKSYRCGFYEIETIEFIGLVSNICVISNICVFQAAFPNAQIVIDPKLTASHDPKAHEAVLEVMKGLQIEFIGKEN